MSRRRALPVLDVPATPCEPVGSLEPWGRCTHPRSCACGASLHLSPSFEAPGFHSWQWAAEDGSRFVAVYPWGTGPCPEGWWDVLAEHDIAMYSALSAREGLGMLAQHHHHVPAEPCAEQCCQSRPAPECHGQPMMAAVEGWRCREARRIYTAPVSA